MANCPKCGRHLKIFDVSQFCPECGTNMRFYGFEENFYKEAKLAELSQAGYHVKIKRLKASFIGSKLTIVRLIVMLFPAVALLLPAASYTFTLPMKEKTVSLGIMGLVDLFTGADLSYIGKMSESAFAGAEFKTLQTMIYAYVSVAVFAVLVLLTSILCFLSYKNMQKITAVVSVLGVADSVCSFIIISNFVKKCSSSAIVTGKISFGLFVVILMFCIVFFVNFLLIRKGIPVEYDEGMLERVEIFKDVKAGKINLDDLPQPVVETAETRKIDEEIAKEEAAYNEKHAVKAEET